MKNGRSRWDDARTSTERPQSAAAEPDPSGLDYARRLYANIREWYDNADRKAQLILTVNGTFVTILSGLALTKPDDVRATIKVFGIETWAFFGLSAASVLLAFVAAALVLWSRLNWHDAGHTSPGQPYDAARIWFFQAVMALDESTFEQRLRALTPGDEIDALADEAIKLSQNVYLKHRYVDVGFFATTLALCALLATAGSYVIRLAT